MGVAKPPFDASEAELIQRVCKGDKEAFYGLVRPYEKALGVSRCSNPLTHIQANSSLPKIAQRFSAGLA